jgi:hypothetical protein
MKTKKPKFECTVDGAIMVTSALRYALGRHTYVPGSVQDWVKCYWDDLDGQTKFNVVRDVFEHLYEEHRSKTQRLPSAFDDYDLETWRKFGIDRYLALNENEQSSVYQSMIGNKEKILWYESELAPQLSGGPFFVFGVFAENCWRQIIPCGEHKTVEEAIDSAQKEYDNLIKITPDIQLVVSDKQYGQEFWRLK